MANLTKKEFSILSYALYIRFLYEETRIEIVDMRAVRNEMLKLLKLKLDDYSLKKVYKQARLLYKQHYNTKAESIDNYTD